jgi:hypothetical protein
MARDRKPISVNQHRGRQLELGADPDDKTRAPPTPPRKPVETSYEERVMTWILAREKSLQKKNVPAPK